MLVVEYYKDADSFGWSVVALFLTADRRWGVLAILVPTDLGLNRTRHVMIEENLNLADWFPDEAAARRFFEEQKSRVW